MIAGDSRGLVQLKHFSTVSMRGGEFCKVPIPMLFLTGLSCVESYLKTIQQIFTVCCNVARLSSNKLFEML